MGKSRFAGVWLYWLGAFAALVYSGGALGLAFWIDQPSHNFYSGPPSFYGWVLRWIFATTGVLAALYALLGLINTIARTAKPKRIIGLELAGLAFGLLTPAWFWMQTEWYDYNGIWIADETYAVPVDHKLEWVTASTRDPSYRIGLCGAGNVPADLLESCGDVPREFQWLAIAPNTGRDGITWLGVSRKKLTKLGFDYDNGLQRPLPEDARLVERRDGGVRIDLSDNQDWTWYVEIGTDALIAFVILWDPDRQLCSVIAPLQEMEITYTVFADATPLDLNEVKNRVALYVALLEEWRYLEEVHVGNMYLSQELSENWELRKAASD